MDNVLRLYIRLYTLNERLWCGVGNWLIYKALTLSGYNKSP